MKLQAYFTIYRSFSIKRKQEEADSLVDTIRAFARMRNYAFWDAETFGGDHCVAVRAYFGTMEDAAFIKADNIESEVRDWCNELKDWCNDDADTDAGMKEYAHKKVLVEISDLAFSGGMHISTHNKDNELEHELYILPHRKKDGGEKKAINKGGKK